MYAELRLADRELGDEEAIGLMAEHPELLQRPVVVRGDRAVLARPIERVLELLDPPPALSGPIRRPGRHGPPRGRRERWAAAAAHPRAAAR